MCMLTVFNSKHDVGDDEDMLSEVAKRKTHHELQVNIITWMLLDEPAPGSQEARNSWGQHVPKNCVIMYFMIIFMFYSLLFFSQNLALVQLYNI